MKRRGPQINSESSPSPSVVLVMERREQGSNDCRYPMKPPGPFCGFLIFLVKKGKWVKLYVWIHTIARSKEHVPMSSEWYLDIFNSTYFDVFMNFVDQKVFKKTIINQKHDFHGQDLVVMRIWSICYEVEMSKCLVWAYLQNTITIGVEFEHCEQLAKSIQIDQI